ncbi:FMN-binding negative transcriptional regulator [Paracoccus sp. S-4012]|uniref:FMN-binding negative transcriptional regulator n=1 Tax=Paracoccus sp. S-4012 TaxID=2665648 RepID=UPI0012AFD05C|nr:FMN-binding negative transcriptional regulator [Paracoccus sp. S-4012]MRX51474.1 FMN-binding negative transcriptional regulator [Paracoccus sp. S-4012]
MYLPPAFREDRPEVMAALIAAHPLALLVTHGSGGLQANPVPMLLRGDVLTAHLARANLQLDDLRQGTETLAVFQGPQTYVTPSWYASKAEHGRVVPTWNYLTVQVHGTPRVIDDANWLLAQVTDLTDGQEAGRADPWKVTDAPEKFIAAQLRGIVGLELSITRMDGKWKASQNRNDADRAGVIRNLAAEGSPFASAVPPPQGA